MSGVFPPDLPSVLTDHHRRIRALEANAAGAPEIWTPITSFLNGWTDAARAGEPPVSVMLQGKLGYLRGRLKPGVLGAPAFMLPTPSAFKEHFITDRWPYGAGSVTVDADVTINRPPTPGASGRDSDLGGIGPYVNPTDLIGPEITNASSYSDLFEPYYHNTGDGVGPTIWYISVGGGFCFDPASISSGTAKPTALRVDRGPYFDSEASLHAAAATTNIYLTVRGQFPYFDGNFPVPIGYHLDVPRTPGSNIVFSQRDRFGAPALLSTPGPGFTTGDKVGFLAIGGRLSALINDVEVASVDVSPADYGQGHCGFGFQGPPGGILLGTLFEFGEPSDVNSGQTALDGIVFATT